MSKHVDEFRKDCIINNLEISPKVNITLQDIQNNILKCPRGRSSLNLTDKSLINKKCFISDLNRKVTMYNTNYADIADVVRNCTIVNDDRIEHFNPIHLYKQNSTSFAIIIGIFIFIVLMSATK